VSAAENPILAFRVNPRGDGDVKLRMRPNNSVVLEQVFDTDPQRSWHEVVAKGVVLAEGSLAVAACPSHA
jgi:hypothetical protein